MNHYHHQNHHHHQQPHVATSRIIIFIIIMVDSLAQSLLSVPLQCEATFDTSSRIIFHTPAFTRTIKKGNIAGKIYFGTLFCKYSKLSLEPSKREISQEKYILGHYIGNTPAFTFTNIATNTIWDIIKFVNKQGYITIWYILEMIKLSQREKSNKYEAKTDKSKEQRANSNRTNVGQKTLKVFRIFNRTAKV